VEHTFHRDIARLFGEPFPRCLSPFGLAGGELHPKETNCATSTCCPYPFADVDQDGDVDQEDYGALQVCYTGTGGGILAGCQCLDSDGDDDIDGADLLSFKACVSGSNIPAIPPPAGCKP